MDRTRIRWTNLARLLGGLAAGGVVVLVLPGLVREPEPPPLPADVGLSVKGEAYARAAPRAEPRRAGQPPDPRRAASWVREWIPSFW